MRIDLVSHSKIKFTYLIHHLSLVYGIFQFTVSITKDLTTKYLSLIVLFLLPHFHVTSKFSMDAASITKVLNRESFHDRRFIPKIYIYEIQSRPLVVHRNHAWIVIASSTPLLSSSLSLSPSFVRTNVFISDRIIDKIN